MHKILMQVRALLATGDVERAAGLLVDQVATLLQQPQVAEQVGALLLEFPADAVDAVPDMLYATGRVHAYHGRLDEALNFLERARFAYAAAPAQLDRSFEAGLDIVQIYFRLDNVYAAYHYLRDELQPLIEQQKVIDARLRGRFFLYLSDISPDFGNLLTGVEYAQRAFNAYQIAQDARGQFRALIRTAAALVHTAQYTEAEAKIEVARRFYQAGQFDKAAYAPLLNVMIHWYWYRGQLRAALQIADQYRELVDGIKHSNFRVYAAVLQGNLLRAMGHHAQAEVAYTVARSLASELDYQRYLPWIDVQTAWLRILQDRLPEARLLLHENLMRVGLGEAMSFQVGLAVVNLIEGEANVAKRLFNQSLSFYLEMSDSIAANAIRFYLALLALRRNDPAGADAQLRPAFDWMARYRIAYLPHWWHPQLFSEVCTYALTAKLYPDVVERIFVHSLGVGGETSLLRIIAGGNENHIAEARRVLGLVKAQPLDELAAFPASNATDVLADLLRGGQLQRTGFDRLQQVLTPGRTHRQPNATLLAVFGLYATGHSRPQIAQQLGCTVANVRNYISLIYKQFGLDAVDFSSREARRQALIEQATERGFL